MIPSEEDAEGRATMVQALTDLARHSQKAGAWLAARTGAEEGQHLKDLIDSLPSMAIGVDFDAGQMMMNGYSANDAMKLLGEHVMNFRARDAVNDLGAGRTVEVQLGRGSVDMPTLLGILEEKHYNGYVTVERDAESDSVLQCSQSLEYLSNLFT